jgi:signal transduction histidine kinase/ActR/RegA family two-component response regulator
MAIRWHPSCVTLSDGGNPEAVGLSALELVAWTTQVLFVLLAVVSVVTAVRRPRPATIDAALFFGALAAIIIESRVAAAFGVSQSQGSADLVVILLVTVSYLLLRLANDFVAVPRVMLRAAEIGLGAIVVVVVLIQSTIPVPVIAVLLAYFAIVTIGAAAVFVRASARSQGVARRRLRAVAWGSYLLGGSIAVAGISTFVPPLAGISGTLIQVGALSSAIAFGVGFIAPGPLRRTWQMAELRGFLLNAGALSRDVDTAGLIREIERAASAALGGRAQVGIYDPENDVLVSNDEHGRVALPVRSALSGPAFTEQRTVYVQDMIRANPQNAAIYRARDIGSIVVSPLTAGDDRLGVLASTQRRALAFDEDDGSLLELIAAVAAVMLQNRKLIDETAAGRDAAEAATRAKSSFLASMSHELRTPLNAVLGFSALLREQLESTLTERQIRYLGNIRDAGEHLLDLINDVLDLSKVEAGRIELRPEILSLEALVEPVLASTTAASAARGVAFDVSVAEGVAVEVDPGRVRQVLYNLTSNAVKFTQPGGRVTFRAEASGGDVHFEVEDTGIGIPADKRDRVFGAFERLHEGVTDVPGTGLGLALSRRLIELHGGSIDFTSVENEGSTFRVDLLKAVGDRLPVDRVLVVEDDRGDADLIVALASGIGLRTEVVRTVDTALAALRRARPRAVVLDLRLPDGRGEFVLQAVRALGHHVPVVVVTVEDDEGVTRPLGADEHLVKPIDGDRLVRWLKAAVPQEDVLARAAG